METDLFVPYLPRIVLEWDRPPEGAAWQAYEGSMVFVDISGFTKMSERLATKGKVGAEEVTEILNSTFTRLLAVAYENGGTLLKFGGDALLLFFYGPEHTNRAVHAAAGMRRKLREMRGLRSSAGPVSLGMSVGVHSGTFHFFLAGETHREFIITGPAASRTVLMESTADAGEVLLSADVAAHIDTKLVGEAKGEGFLLAKMPPPPSSTQGTRLPSIASDLSLFVPPSVREHIATRTSSDAEHRQVTVAFIHYDGTDSLIEERGPQELASRLHALVSSSSRAATANEVTFLGTDIDHDGGKIILVAGTPRATGHDEERMLRALRSIVEEGPSLPIRIGVNRGHVFAGDVGPRYRTTYTIMGDAVNLAARLMAKAEPGQIVASPDVLRRSRTLFTTSNLEPFLVKGKAKPVTAHVVGEICGVREARPGGRLPLVGRDNEMATIRQALASLRSGAGSSLHIVAEAGLGKSRLVEELRTESEPDRFVRAAAEQYESSTPYFPFRSLLRQMLGIPLDSDGRAAGQLLAGAVERTAPELLPWLPLLAIPVDADAEPTHEVNILDDQFKRTRLEASVADLIARIIDTPTVLLFEDAHWMDEASVDLIGRLSRDATTSGYLLVATGRPGVAAASLRENVDHAMELGPLSEDASARLVRFAAESLSLPVHVLTALAERGGGHPLFLQELVASQEDGDIESLPDSVEAVIIARLDTLPSTEKSLLRYASVVGSAFNLDLLTEALPDEIPRLLERTDWLALDEFIERQGDSHSFKQSLFRDVAYESLPFRRRREAHERVGEVIERRQRGEEHAEILSLHFHRAQRFDRSWRYSVAAAKRAETKFANVQAAEFYRRALDAAKRVDEVHDEDMWPVEESLGTVSDRAGLYQEALMAFRNARQHATIEEAVPRLRYKEGLTQVKMGAYSPALRSFSHGLDVAEKTGQARSNDSVELGLAYAFARFKQGRYKDCIARCRQIVDVARATDNRPGLAHAYSMMHLALSSIGDPQRTEFRDLALPIYVELGDLPRQASVLNNLGLDLYFEGRWDEALDHYRRSQAIERQIGNVEGEADSINNVGEIQSDQGRFEEAEATFKEAAALYRGSRSKFGIALSAFNLGRTMTRAGQHTEADRLLCEAREGFKKIKAEAYLAETEARLAELLVFTGRSRAALQQVDTALGLAVKAGGMASLEACLHRLRGYAQIQLGETSDASASLETSLSLAIKANADFERALSLEARARLLRSTDREAANEDQTMATKIFERLGVVATQNVPTSSR